MRTIRYRHWPTILVLFGAALLRLHRLASVPFGWHPDEATKALLARDVLAGKFHPIFFSAFTGREALYVYLEALLFVLVGEGVFAGRLLSAVTGILTVALTFALGRTLFSRRVALLAAGFLAISLWHVIASRNGYRAVLQPLIQLPVLILLFKGWRQERDGKEARIKFVLAGAFLGLTQYTYTAARFFPILVVVLAAIGTLFLRRLIWRHRIGLLLAALTALLVFLPLGWHFWQHPLDFYGRAAQISVFSDAWADGRPWARLWQSVVETGRMFTSWGDINYRFNVSGQPVFGVIDGVLFMLGLLVCLWGAVAEQGMRRLAFALLLIWTGIMLLPMALSAESLPYYQRAIGVLPAVMFFPALAIEQMLRWTPGRFRLHAAVAVAVLFAWFGGRVYGDYFNTWHRAEQNDDDRRVAMVYVADYLQETSAAQNGLSDAPLYLSTQYVQHPTLALLAPEQYDGIHWFDARQALPLPVPGEEATYIFLLENAPQPELLQRAATLEPAGTGLDRFGRPVFQVYRWPEGGEYPVPNDQGPAIRSWEVTFSDDVAPTSRQPVPLPANFGDLIAFAGHDRSAAVVQPGETLSLVLHWEIIARPRRVFAAFAHLLNQDGEVVAGYDALEYPAVFWQEGGGERLLSYFPLALPPELPAGTYQVEIGVYHQPTGERLQVLAGGEAVANRLLLPPVEVRPAP